MKRKSNDTKLMWSIHRKDVYKYLKKAEWKRLTGGQKEREKNVIETTRFKVGLK